jgi:hypothetical protein
LLSLLFSNHHSSGSMISRSPTSLLVHAQVLTIFPLARAVVLFPRLEIQRQIRMLIFCPFRLNLHLGVHFGSLLPDFLAKFPSKQWPANPLPIVIRVNHEFDSNDNVWRSSIFDNNDSASDSNS